PPSSATGGRRFAMARSTPKPPRASPSAPKPPRCLLRFDNFPRYALIRLCQTAGWPLSAAGASARRGEESPGSTETRCRVTPGEGDLRESATESKPPNSCDLSGPPGRQG